MYIWIEKAYTHIDMSEWSLMILGLTAIAILGLCLYFKRNK